MRASRASSEIDALAQQDQACVRLMSVPGIGPVISSAMVAAIGTGDVFYKGDDFGAWLGLVPKQISTGDRTILGSISKRGNRYLRALFVQAAWVVLVKLAPENWAVMGSSLGLRQRKSDCTTMCSPLRWPTSWPASPGRFTARGAPSRSSKPMRCPVPRNPRAVLGPVKA
nr:transposase [Bradyrhizobium erythrophlei]